MKVNLVVTVAGPNQGRLIPITGARFVIGRDPSCQLRPASQAISKQHCAIHIRDGQVWVEDFGSMNGTVVNDVAVTGEQIQAKDGDTLKVGPLEFRLQIAPLPTPTDGTPLPDKLLSLSGGSTGVKPSNPGVKPPANSPAKSASAPANKPVPIKSAPAPTPAAMKPAPVPVKPAVEVETAKDMPPVSAAAPGDDDAAAMLLSLEDTPSGEQPNVPDGSTVTELPAVDAAGRIIPPKPPEKKDVESSSAAGDLLKKYFRRTSS